MEVMYGSPYRYFVSCSLKAVSYTHLDVYKRQQVHTWIIIGVECISDQNDVFEKSWVCQIFIQIVVCLEPFIAIKI